MKFKFKLEGLLKLREFKEHKKKVEIGKINQEIHIRKSMIETCKKDISLGFQSQEESLNEGLEGKSVHFYPYFIQGKREHIKNLESEIAELEVEFKQRVEELNVLRGEAKLIEKMKEREEKEYYRELNKKREASIQDDYIITRVNSERK